MINECARIMTVSVPLEPERSAAMRYRSDHLGRMASITYPDGEVITYTI